MSTRMPPTQSSQITVDQAVGLSVNQHLFAAGFQAQVLAHAIGVSPSSLSRKLRGNVGWSAEDLLLTAAFFDLEAQDLMPHPDGKGGWIPAPFTPGYAKTPALAGASSEPPVGIEPTTYSLRVNRSAD